jgi:hypothetical protein
VVRPQWVDAVGGRAKLRVKRRGRSDMLMHPEEDHVETRSQGGKDHEEDGDHRPPGGMTQRHVGTIPHALRGSSIPAPEQRWLR